MNWLSRSLGILWCSGFSAALSYPVLLISGWAGWLVDLTLLWEHWSISESPWQRQDELGNYWKTANGLQVLLLCLQQYCWVIVDENGFSHLNLSGLHLKKAYANFYSTVFHLSYWGLHENILCTWKEAFRGLDSNKTSVFYHCFSVFTMGNNSYGQCGRKVVEDETYRWESKDPELP